MNQRTSLFWGAVIAGAAVAIGAFGAHALKPMLVAAGRENTFELAVRYQFYHAFALLIVGLLGSHIQSRRLNYSTLFFLAGILIFSGSLYVLCLTGISWLGAITPLGGMSFLAGWILLGITIWKHKTLQR
jgi:uncharacterized membrane protein YgdD (TMEM256/DUF423 family)